MKVIDLRFDPPLTFARQLASRLLIYNLKYVQLVALVAGCLFYFYTTHSRLELCKFIHQNTSPTWPVQTNEIKVFSCLVSVRCQAKSWPGCNRMLRQSVVWGTWSRHFRCETSWRWRSDDVSTRFYLILAYCAWLYISICDYQPAAVGVGEPPSLASLQPALWLDNSWLM